LFCFLVLLREECHRKFMLCSQKGSPEAFAAYRQSGEEPQCSGGFGWGYSEKVSGAVGKKLRSYLEPNSNSMQKPIGVLAIGGFQSQKHVEERGMGLF
jgi:hypothetical protein